jgi:hypothetical protein
MLSALARIVCITLPQWFAFRAKGRTSPQPCGSWQMRSHAGPSTPDVLGPSVKYLNCHVEGHCGKEKNRLDSKRSTSVPENMRFTLGSIALWAMTWPYHWTFKHYTLVPIRNIAACGSDISRLRSMVLKFTDGKSQELTFVNIAVRVHNKHHTASTNRRPARKLTRSEHTLRRSDRWCLLLAFHNQHTLACTGTLVLQSPALNIRIDKCSTAERSSRLSLSQRDQ